MRETARRNSMGIGVQDVGVAILAGGKSSRMGSDKGLVMLDGYPLVERIIRQISHLFEDIFIVTNKPEGYSQFGYPIVGDVIRDVGPLGGVYTALDYDKNDYTLILSCDMPFVCQGILVYLLDIVEKYQAVVPRMDKLSHPEPLRALYRNDCLKQIYNYLKTGGRKAIGFYDEIDVRYVERKEIEDIDPGAMSFFNANTPYDLVEAGRLTKYYPLI